MMPIQRAGLFFRLDPRPGWWRLCCARLQAEQPAHIGGDLNTRVTESASIVLDEIHKDAMHAYEQERRRVPSCRLLVSK